MLPKLKIFKLNIKIKLASSFIRFFKYTTGALNLTTLKNNSSFIYLLIIEN